jgi:signal recognition particle receptor subunit beta
MPLLNNRTREISTKIVYYGPGFSGKTTNLQFIHSQLSPTTRGDLISMATQTDRTLSFDFLPLDIGNIKGWQVRFALFTVPGQVEYNASRKLILNGVDAIVFVSDSDPARRLDNFEALENMASNLAEFGLSLDKMPWVMQHNKRDLSTAMTLEQMELDMNTLGVPSFESIAIEGLGVFATLRAVSKLLMEELSTFVT